MMTVEERLKKVIDLVKCPETGSDHYGAWGILTRTQRIFLDVLARDTLDLIHRLQVENAGLKERGEKIINELHKTIDKQKAEIELLRKDKSFATSKMMESKAKAVELQKQVDELTKIRNSFQQEVITLNNEKLELQKQVNELENNKLKGEIIMKNVNELMDEIKEQCGDCEAWSGTDCTRNPYTQGCLKDEKQVIECYGMLKGCDMVKQAVKDTAEKIQHEATEAAHAIVKGELVVSISKLEEICKRITEGER